MRKSNINAWKVMVPASNGSPAIGSGKATTVIGRPVIAGPGTGHTQSFISFGAFGSEDEATACMRYICSRLARALLGILKVTQHNHGGIWRIVPTQDFEGSTDIDWNADQNEVDRKLYDRYGLSDDEVSFIEANVAPLKGTAFPSA